MQLMYSGTKISLDDCRINILHVILVYFYMMVHTCLSMQSRTAHMQNRTLYLSLPTEFGELEDSINHLQLPESGILSLRRQTVSSKIQKSLCT